MLDIGKTLLSDLLFLLFVATELSCCCEGTQIAGLRATFEIAVDWESGLGPVTIAAVGRAFLNCLSSSSLQN